MTGCIHAVTYRAKKTQLPLLFPAEIFHEPSRQDIDVENIIGNMRKM